MIKNLDVKARRADFKFRSRLEAPFSIMDKANLRLTLSRNGQTRQVADFPVYSYHPIADFTLTNADLWWPRGSVPASSPFTSSLCWWFGCVHPASPMKPP